MGLAAPTAWPWAVIVGAPLLALAGAAIVAVVAARGPVRVRPGQDLRVE